MSTLLIPSSADTDFATGQALTPAEIRELQVEASMLQMLAEQTDAQRRRYENILTLLKAQGDGADDWGD